MANVTYTVPNKSGSYDGDMVVKQYTSMIIDAGDTVTTDQPCRGLLILVQGNCTINGTLSMKARGAFANPTTGGGSDGNPVDSNGLRLPFLTNGGSSTLTASGSLFNGCGNDALSVIANFKTISGNGDILQVTRTGAGNTTPYGGSAGSRNKFNNGTSGTNHLGGGGEGSIGYGGGEGTGKSATCFSGGSAGGGRNNAGATDTTGGNYGGQGGLGRSGHTARCTGGAGNPNGNETTNGSYGGATNSSNGESGTGGSIWLIVGGNLTIGASGLITVQGSRSDSINGNGYEWCSTGGGSGGGSIKIAYKGTFTNNGTINVNGGLAGVPFNDGAGNYSSEGGNGGNGTYTALQVL
jgi:hypothetical protein